jgi:DNA-binding NarL/FixJ family response regulator
MTPQSKPNPKPADSPPPNGHPLPPRQAQIARLIARGLTDKEIAVELGVSENTIGRHLGVIYRRLAIHSRTALVARALSQHSSPPHTDAI